MQQFCISLALFQTYKGKSMVSLYAKYESPNCCWHGNMGVLLSLLISAGNHNQCNIFLEESFYMYCRYMPKLLWHLKVITGCFIIFFKKTQQPWLFLKYHTIFECILCSDGEAIWGKWYTMIRRDPRWWKVRTQRDCKTLLRTLPSWVSLININHP